MMRRKPQRPPTPEENRARNIERILNPPKPTLYERARSRVWAVERWWSDHVTHREVHRLLTNARLDMDALRAAHQHNDDCGRYMR